MSRKQLTLQMARECVYTILDVNRAINAKFIDEQVAKNNFTAAANMQLAQQKTQDEFRSVFNQLTEVQSVKDVFSDMYGITVMVLKELRMPIPNMLQLAKICIERQ